MSGERTSEDRPECDGGGKLRDDTGLYYGRCEGCAACDADIARKRSASARREATSEEADHFAEIRRVAEGIRARGDFASSVRLSDGVVATLSLNLPDPFAAPKASDGPPIIDGDGMRPAGTPRSSEAQCTCSTDAINMCPFCRAAKRPGEDHPVDDYPEKYFVKARVYGAIAAHFRAALEAIAKPGSTGVTILAREALEWRYSEKGGVPRADLDAFEALLVPRSEAARPEKDPIRREVELEGMLIACLSHVDDDHLRAAIGKVLGIDAPPASCTADALPGELNPLAQRIAKGRAKYANGCTVLSLIDEAGEVAHAVNKYEPAERVRDELLDVAAVAMRLYFGEIDRGLAMDGLVQRRVSQEDAASMLREAIAERDRERDQTSGGARKEPLATRERTTPSTPVGEPEEAGTSSPNAWPAEQCKWEGCVKRRIDLSGYCVDHPPVERDLPSSSSDQERAFNAFCEPEAIQAIQLLMGDVRRETIEACAQLCEERSASHEKALHGLANVQAPVVDQDLERYALGVAESCAKNIRKLALQSSGKGGGT